MLVSEFVEADSVSGFVTGQLMEMLFRFFGESIANTVTAFIWPVYVIQLQPPWGIAGSLTFAFLSLLTGLAIAFFLFDRFLKPIVEQWLPEAEVAEEVEEEPDAT